ncbi:hypothetical protein Naga_102707g1, partial [Nannochloropsis gaditana]
PLLPHPPLVKALLAFSVQRSVIRTEAPTTRPCPSSSFHRWQTTAQPSPWALPAPLLRPPRHPSNGQMGRRGRRGGGREGNREWRRCRPAVIICMVEGGREGGRGRENVLIEENGFQ